MTKLKERFFTALFAINAVFSVLAVLMICLFLFANALPTMSKIGFVEFIFGFEWFPSEDLFGIFAMIIGSLYVTALAIFIGVPLGVLSAIYLSCFCHKRLKKFLMPCVELLGAIPSVVYGFFGLVVIVPTLSSLYGGISGKGVLAASLVLAIMILPTIILLSKAAIDALPKSYYEGALALGASKERSVFFCSCSCGKEWNFSFCDTWRWQGYRRGYGCDYGSWQSSPNPTRLNGRCANAYYKHSARNGLCD